MHDLFHMDGESKFRFDWKELPRSGLSAKGLYCPQCLCVQHPHLSGGRPARSHELLSITASDLSDQLLKDFLGMESSQIVTMHIHSVDQNKAIKTVKRTITELDRSKIEEQKRAVRAGYDIDILTVGFGDLWPGRQEPLEGATEPETSGCSWSLSWS